MRDGHTEGFSGAPFLRGGAASAFVFTLFHFLQHISDSAPAFIRASDIPGFKFTNGVLRNAMAGRGFVLSASFGFGAFAVMGIYFFAVKYLT